MISYRDCIMKFSSVEVQFELARKAIDAFKANPENIIDFVKKSLKRLKQLTIDFSGDEELWQETVSLPQMREFIKYELGITLIEFEGMQNRLNQNELVLYTALFEAYLKNIHRKILKLNPRLCKKEFKIDLGHLISLGQEEIVNREIEREIYSLDRKAFKDKVVYFKEHLLIDWQIHESVMEKINSIIDIRNRVLHSDSEQKVDNSLVSSAQGIFVGILISSINQASKCYPDGFKSSLENR